MKVAIFTDTYAPEVNGVAKTLKRFTEYLADNNHEFRVFAPKVSGTDLFSSDIHRFSSLPFYLYKECRWAIPNIAQVKEELIQFQPDIIHVATPFNIGLCGSHYAKKLDIPLVGSYHTDFDKYLEYYNLKFLTSMLWKYLLWFYRPFQRIFVPSTDTMNHIKNHGFTNLSVWARGVDCELFHPNYNKLEFRKKYNIKSKYVCLYVGRISPEKDIMLLPEINAKLPTELRENVHWLIVGDGPAKGLLEQEAPSNMTFAGFLSGQNLAEAYASSDLFVFPSATETFGNVVLESLASGTPVVGANAGGVSGIIQEDKTGKLAEEKNIESFTYAIQHLLLAEEKMKWMGKMGREYALTQSWDQIFATLLSEYEEIIGGVSYRILA
ncbi:glycosyltransferase family 1 protein [Oceanobacillus piezotolerans]|uniref:Glycosyltransferase family 1 protein n=1 Tax=Oceanobacillus piezotolerans TaxID=2448030 RepID=A0A498DKZ6_9BACI|nr:glycosyltransferase family 1 protein [Oceanobacillus piezotolerans]RLL47710.1 glycosyltransferase family 1 protein [Oceanobacillus piezotolerans]